MFKKLHIVTVIGFVLSLVLMPLNSGLAQTHNPPATDTATFVWPISPDKWTLVSVNIKRQYDPVTKTYITLTREVREMRNPNFVPKGINSQTYLACNPKTLGVKSVYATQITCSYIGTVQVTNMVYANGVTQTIKGIWGKYQSYKPSNPSYYYKPLTVSTSFKRSSTSVAISTPVSWSFGCVTCFYCDTYPNYGTTNTTGSFSVSWLSSNPLQSTTYAFNANSTAFAGLTNKLATSYNRVYTTTTVVWGRSIASLSTYTYIDQ